MNRTWYHRFWHRPWGLLLVIWAILCPLPAGWAPWRPDWAGLWVIYHVLWSSSRTTVLWKPWLLGLCCDVITDYPLGAHGAALCVIAYLVALWRLQVRVFPMWQQMVCMVMWLGLAHVVLVWALGLVGRPMDFTHHALVVIGTVALWPIGIGLGRTRVRWMG